MKLTCHIYGIENVWTRVEVKLRYWFDLGARVACSVSRRFRNHQPGILNGLILQGLKKFRKLIITEKQGKIEIFDGKFQK